jgi:hypothetical protein
MGLSEESLEQCGASAQDSLDKIVLKVKAESMTQITRKIQDNGQLVGSEFLSDIQCLGKS